MAKFCIYCGKPLPESGICDCQQAKAPVNETAETPVQNVEQFQQNVEAQVIENVTQATAETPVEQVQENAEQVASQATQQQGQQTAGFQSTYNGNPNYVTPQPSQANAVIKEAISSFVEIWKAPVDAGRAFVVSDKLPSALIFIGLQAVLSAIFAMAATARLTNLVVKLVNVFISSFANIDLKPSVGPAFLLTLIGSIAFSAILAALLLGISQLFKNRVNYQQMLQVMGVRSVLVSPVILLSLLLVLVLPSQGLGLFFFSAVIGVCVIMTVLPISNGANHNMTVYIAIISLLIFTIVAYFVMSYGAEYFIPAEIRNYSSSSSSLYDLFY